YQQIGGLDAFDADGTRNSNPAVFILTEGTYFCMIAESEGEAALFDAPEGSFVKSSDVYPTDSWIPESIHALIGEGTRLKTIVYSHTHWDHVGAAGIVAEAFKDDYPVVVGSKASREWVVERNMEDPATILGNNRGIPVSTSFTDRKSIEVGGLKFKLEELGAHQSGDITVYLDKTSDMNYKRGITQSVLMVVDVIFPGWIPFFNLAVASDVGGYLKGLDKIYEFDFDIIVGGHISRLGTKEDVKTMIDFFADVTQGAIEGLAVTSAADIAARTGVFDPTNANAGNIWLLFNEFFERVVDVCVDYVLDAMNRGRDWTAELAGVDVTIRSQCWSMQSFIRIA
ncbi:unnamed protein product, partial [Choristocarpus tenellus]